MNKLADGFVKVKGKITETVKESEAVKKIGTAVEGAKQKVEAFKDAHPAVQKVADAFGKVKTAVNDVKEKIPPVSAQLKAVGDAAATAAKGGFTVLTNVVGGTMKAFAGFSAAVVSAGAAVAKSAVEQYAEYEQLVGGVETLFKDSAGEVQNYANNAYKTAGMSANQYMETVTGFQRHFFKASGRGHSVALKKRIWRSQICGQCKKWVQALKAYKRHIRIRKAKLHNVGQLKAGIWRNKRRNAKAS